MTNVNASTTTYVCPKCGQEKLLTREFWFPRKARDITYKIYACRICANEIRRDKCREYAAKKRSTIEGRNSNKISRKAWKERNRDKVIEQLRRRNQRKAEQEGRKYCSYYVNKKQPDGAYDRIIEKNARDAFNWWFAKKSDAEVAVWYEHTGKPWENPRLTEGQKWSVRYQVDLEFRESEKTRMYLKKMKRKRKVIVETDGTVPCDILEKAKFCIYCGVKFNSECKPTLDHLVPLSKGGTHSAANVVVCCRSCNSRKGNREFSQFIETLSDKFKNKAWRAWRKLRGAPPQQQLLIM